MDKHSETNPSQKPAESQADLAAMLQAVLLQMARLEKKVDTLMEQTTRPPRQDRPFTRDSRQPSGKRPFFHDSKRQGKHKGRNRDFPRRDKESRPQEYPEKGVFIRANPHGEHYTRKRHSHPSRPRHQEP